MFNVGTYTFGPGSESAKRQMAKADQQVIDMVGTLQARLEALEAVGEAAIAWRSAEVHASAIVLGIREGNKEMTAEAAEKKLCKLRGAIDNYNKVK